MAISIVCAIAIQSCTYSTGNDEYVGQGTDRTYVMLIFLLFPENGDSDSFDELVDRYEKKIFNLIYRIVGDYDEAADLTQDTFVAAYKSFGSFRGEAEIFTWIYRIAVNNCKNRFKYKDRIRELEGDPVDDGVMDLVTTSRIRPSQESPHSAVEQKELKRMIEEAINHLPYDYRIVAVMRDIQGLSYQDIADATGLGMDVVKTRLARARCMLRRKLGPYLGE